MPTTDLTLAFNKTSLYMPEKDEKAHRLEIDQDLQRLFTFIRVFTGGGTGGGGMPPGVDTNIIYNDGGNFNGATYGLYKKSNGHLAFGPASSLDSSFADNIDSTSVTFTKQTVNLGELFTDQTVNAIGIYGKFTVNYASSSSSKFPMGMYMDCSVPSGNTSDIHYASIGVNIRNRNLATSGTTTRLDALRLVVGDASSSSTTTYSYGLFMKCGFNQTLSNSQERVGIYLSDEKGSDGNDTPGGKTGLYIHGHQHTTTQTDLVISARNILSARSQDATQAYKESFNVFAGPSGFGSSTLPSTASVVAGPLIADGDGTISTSGTTVSGSGTAFDISGGGDALYNGNPSPGDYLIQNSSFIPRLISTTSSSTDAVLHRAFPSNLSGAGYTWCKPVLRWEKLFGIDGNDSSGRHIGGVISANGFVGIGTLTPTANLDIYTYFKTGDEMTVEQPIFRTNGGSVLLGDGTTLSTWRHNVLLAPTIYGKSGGSLPASVTTASTLYVEGPPVAGSDCSIGASYAIQVGSGGISVGGTTSIAGTTNWMFYDNDLVGYDNDVLYYGGI